MWWDVWEGAGSRMDMIHHSIDDWELLNFGLIVAVCFVSILICFYFVLFWFAWYYYYNHYFCLDWRGQTWFGVVFVLFMFRHSFIFLFVSLFLIVTRRKGLGWVRIWQKVCPLPVWRCSNLLRMYKMSLSLFSSSLNFFLFTKPDQTSSSPSSSPSPSPFFFLVLWPIGVFSIVFYSLLS